ncbi:LptF/LptG family permease [Algoriphagus sediminis]|uniref:LptF/LptG family permease n=1 Tax=Algoriphagus sediminis TaxID=3057113 RepID=A0ABT7YDV6_9BACT|nr:LptF/LptG family permease [Algoriphagus sediminis]MDN3204374.1 LptF/LptG family permease [Algoriphagus sediminis]
MKKLDKLILGSFLGPFLLTFVVVDFILLTVNMLKYFDEIFGKGLGFWIYMELIGYFVISISPMALPLAVLLSSLMTFGNLGEHFELTAIKSSGISLLRTLLPIGVFVLILSVFAYLSNNYVVPKVNLKTFSLLYDIRMKSPALEIKEGVFYDGIPNYSIKVNEKIGEKNLRDIIIYDHSEGIGNLNVTLADSGIMESFNNEKYLRFILFNGKNYSHSRAERGIRDAPVEFSRTAFKENTIVFNLDAFELDRTPEDLWSTNRAIKNISQIKDGLDSINTRVNDQLWENYQTAEGIYSYMTKNRSLDPPTDIYNRRALDDTARMLKSRRMRAERDSLDQVAKMDSIRRDSIRVANNPDLRINPPKEEILTNAVSELSKSDSLFRQKKIKNRNERDSSKVISKDTLLEKEKPKFLRTAPLTTEEKSELDSILEARRYMDNALTMATNNARNLKNTFNTKKVTVENHQREFRRYQIAWYQKYTQAFACIVMFMIGAPLGAIIKKGGLGAPVLFSIIFFILYYMLTITGEKWAKEGVVDPLLGTWFSNLALIPFGLFFLKQARKDARLFEPDFYQSAWKKLKKTFSKKSSFA